MLYMYEAIKRPKENTDMSGIKCIREVGYPRYSESEMIEKLRRKISVFPGVWRIYRSVNARDEVKAKLELIETLTRQLVLPKSVSDKDPEALWKDALMQPHNKAERLFLLDIDTKDSNIIKEVLSIPQIAMLHGRATPNGHHMVCEPFDPRLVEHLQEYVSVKKDALLYLETITIGDIK